MFKTEAELHGLHGCWKGDEPQSNGHQASEECGPSNMSRSAEGRSESGIVDARTIVVRSKAKRLTKESRRGLGGCMLQQ